MKHYITTLTKMYLLIILMVCSIVLSAQTTKTFTGAHDDFWYAPENWNPSGVPTAGDNVVIPEGKSAKIPYSSTIGNAVANTVTNNGTLILKDGVIQTNSFTNNATVTVVNADEKQKSTITGHGENKPDVTNNGTIQSTQSTYGTLTIDGKNVTNNGSITTHDLKIKGQNVANNEGAVIETGKRCADLNITGQETIVNKGEIKTKENVGMDINLSGKKVTNEGTISTGNGNLANHTGNITINATFATNSSGGTIQTGSNSSFAELNGKIKINGHFDNFGRVRSGRSPGSLSGKKDDQYFNNVTLCGDTIRLYGDSTRIEADTLRIWFNYLEIAFVTQYACIWGDMVVEFYGSEGAVANLSSPDNGAGIISIGYGGIAFFCDNILEPPLGLNYICDLPPTVAPSDTAITGASVSEGFGVLQTGTSGLVQVAFQNQSTLPKAFQYSITDQKGWVQDATGTTSQVQSFLFDSVTFSYTIPNLPDSVPDTVIITLSHGGESVLAEAIWVLYSYQEPLSGVWEADGKRRDLIETFPVPFARDLTIRAIEDVFITIMDPMGRVILSEQVKKSNTFTWIPTGNYTGGLYLIVAENERTGTEVERVIYQPE